MRTPILILQGDQDPLNRFNGQVLIPELRAMGKALEVNTYPGEPHCFAFLGSGPRSPHAAVALKAFQDAETFFRRHVGTKPKPMDTSQVKVVPIQ